MFEDGRSKSLALQLTDLAICSNETIIDKILSEIPCIVLADYTSGTVNLAIIKNDPTPITVLVDDLSHMSEYFTA